MAEEERKKKNKADVVRERALNQMMNGVLEIKKEDELKKVYFYIKILLTKVPKN